MENTEEKNNVTSVENNVVASGNNGSNAFEDCTSDNPIDDKQYLFVTKEEVMMLDPMAIHTASPFKDLFPIREKDLKNIEESMKNNGFNSGLPITLWAGHDTIVVDGHTRLAAAKKLLFAQIPVILKNFKVQPQRRLGCHVSRREIQIYSDHHFEYHGLPRPHKDRVQ